VTGFLYVVAIASGLVGLAVVAWYFLGPWE
jgi:hypothetical protein